MPCLTGGVSHVIFNLHLGLGHSVLLQLEGVGHVFSNQRISKCSGPPPPPCTFWPVPNEQKNKQGYTSNHYGKNLLVYRYLYSCRHWVVLIFSLDRIWNVCQSRVCRWGGHIKSQYEPHRKIQCCKGHSIQLQRVQGFSLKGGRGSHLCIIYGDVWNVQSRR